MLEAIVYMSMCYTFFSLSLILRTNRAVCMTSLYNLVHQKGGSRV
jgi:TRAP-type C4-dicarboxylate transport system permease small subunit